MNSGLRNIIVPRADMLVGNARRDMARILQLPTDAVRFILPNGRTARSDKRLGDLRSDWEEENINAK